MALTLLQFVNRAELQLGLAQSNAVVSSNVTQAQQMLGMAQGALEELYSSYEWRKCVRAYYFTTTPAVSGTCNVSSATATLSGFASTAGLAAGMVITGPGIAPYAEVDTVGASTVIMTYPATATTASASCNFCTQDYDLPSGFDRMVPDTNWDRTDYWRNIGPKSSQEWQWLQGGVISTGPRERFRIYGDKLRFFPAPTAALNIAFEYVSNFTVIASGGTTATKAAFTVDTDTCIFRDELIVKALKYHWKQAKGLDYGAELAEYADALSRAKAQDEPVGIQSLAPRFAQELIGPWSVPDGNWPQ